MAIPIVLTIGNLAAAVVDFFAVSATPVSGTALTLAHTTVATPRRVLLTTGSEASGRTMRLTGTNADGNPIRETLTIPATTIGTVQSIQDFLTLTEALPLGGGWSAAMTLGTSGVASSPWKLINVQHQAYPSISWFGEATGTVNWGIQIAWGNPNNNQNNMGSAFGNYPDPITPIDFTGLMNQNGNGNAAYADPFQCWRAIINSGTGSVKVTALEGGMTESGGV